MATIPAAVVDEELAQPSLLSSAPGVSEIDRSKGTGGGCGPPPPPPEAPGQSMHRVMNDN